MEQTSLPFHYEEENESTGMIWTWPDQSQTPLEALERVAGVGW